MGNSIKSALHTNLRDIHIAHKQQFTCISYPHLQYIILKRFARFTLKEAAECSRIHGSQRGYFIQVDLSRKVYIQVSYDIIASRSLIYNLILEVRSRYYRPGSNVCHLFQKLQERSDLVNPCLQRNGFEQLNQS